MQVSERQWIIDGATACFSIDTDDSSCADRS